MSNHNTYGITKISDIGLIDFNQIGQTSALTVRKNVSETEFVIKWEEDSIPTFIANGDVVPLATLTHSEAVSLMQTANWSEEE